MSTNLKTDKLNDINGGGFKKNKVVTMRCNSCKNEFEARNGENKCPSCHSTDVEIIP